MRTFEYRLYPNKEQGRLLMQCLSETRHLYNEMLEVVKAQYAEKGTFPGKYELTARFKGRGGEHVPATTVQTLADRLTKALKRYLAFRELGEQVGFPRFVRHEVAFITVVPGVPGHNPLFCQWFPTETCVIGNDGVRSFRDNDILASAVREV